MGREEIETLIRLSPGEELVRRAAEDLTRALYGGDDRRCRPEAHHPPGPVRFGRGDPERLPEADGSGLERLEGMVEEMSSLGLVYLVLDLGGLEDFPCEPEDFREPWGRES